MRALLALAALLLVAVVPAIEGQTGVPPPSFVLKTPTATMQALRPDLDVSDVSVPWTYSFNNAVTPFLTEGQSATLRWSPVECSHPGVVAPSPPDEVIQFTTATATTGRVDGVSHFQVRVASDAPGELAITCTIRGQVGNVNGIIPASSVAQAPFTVAALYRGLLSVDRLDAIVQGAPGTVLPFRLKVTNLANSETKVQLRLDGALPTGWKADMGPAVVLGSKLKGSNDTVAVATVHVSVPANTTVREAALRFVVEGGSVKDDRGTSPPVVVVVLARVAGTAPANSQGATPGKVASAAGPLFAVGLLAVAAIARRRAV